MVDGLARRAHELLRSAVEVDPARRMAFVQEACAGDAALAARLIGLLGAIDRSRGFLETPALALRAGPTVDVTRPRDETIGGYRIVGMTGLDPDQRFDRHKAGIQANRFVSEYGLRLLPALYAVYNPMPYDAAREMEVELAIGLREAGYAVWQA